MPPQKNIILLFCVVLFCNACGLAKSRPASNTTHSPRSASSEITKFANSRLHHLNMYSKSLNANMGVAVYLPAGYDRSKSYPVLYSFYGYGGNQYSLFNSFMSINRTADKLLAKGTLLPLIIVVPDYKNSFGVNSTREQRNNTCGGTIGLYEDYLIHELIPYIDQQFSTDKRRKGRFIDGYSMGGFAALYLGFNYPKLFSKIGAHSSALWDYSANDIFIGQRNWLYASPTLRTRRDPFLLAQSQDLRDTDIYLDAGNEDNLFKVNQVFYRHLLTKGIRVRWQAGRGGHNTTYWNANMENYLLFYTNDYTNEDR